jgi:hypothetical protein
VLYCTNYVQTNESGRVDNAHLFEYYIGIIAMIQGSLGFRRVKVLDSPTLYLAVQDKCLLGEQVPPEVGQARDSNTSPPQTPRDPLL